MEIILLLCAALLPVAVMLTYIYIKDKEKPEPKGKLIKALFFGILSTFLSLTFSWVFDFDDDNLSSVTEAFADAFLSASIPEELAKLIMLWLVVRKNPYFDEHFDGIIYSVCVGMGFAGFENVMYLFDDLETGEWITTCIMRAFLAIPGHFVFAVFMGYFYSLYHFGISRNKSTAAMILVAPVLAHGVYDGFIMATSMADDMCLVYIALGLVSFVWMCLRALKYIKALKGH